MPDITITIAPDATGTITIADTTTALGGATVDHTRQEAMQHAMAHARMTGQPATITAQDPSGSFYLTVQPDGNVIDRPAPIEASGPGWEQEPALIVTEVPDAPSTPGSAAPAPQMPSSPAVAQPVSPAPVPPMPQPAPGAAQSQPSPAPAPEPDPVESDPRWRGIAQRPAEEGFRGTLNGMGLKLAPTEDEIEQRRERLREEIAREELERAAEEERARTEAAQQTRRAARAREEAQRDREQRDLIQTNFQGTKTILVANPKGGSRKTTTTYNVAATLGIIRGGSVIAWDANETMGTLGERARPDLHNRTVVDLIQDAAAEFNSIEGSRLGRLDNFVRPQGDAHVDGLASDEDPTRQDIVDEAGFGTVHEILSRFYRMILVDTGNNIRVSHFLAAVEAADQLVIPVAAGRDSARAADKMMKSLAASGHEDLVNNAVVLIHDLEARTNADPEYQEVASAVAAGFEGRVSAVVPIPFDPALKDGDQIDYDALQPATKRAYQEATAAIATSLRTRLAKQNQS